MNLEQVKQGLYRLIKEYFHGAEVVWAGQKAVKHVLPLVTLKVNSLSRSTFPIEEDEDGSPVNHYSSRAMMEVQLFTKGAVPPQSATTLSNAANTAVNDMADFVNYMGSHYALGRMIDEGFSVMPEGPIQDVSALLDNVRNEYRAMQEFTVDFVQESREEAGIAAGPETAWKPTSSGGGTQKLADLKTGWTNEIEVEKED